MKTRFKRISSLAIVILIAIMFSSCAEAVSVDQCVGEDPYGFWGGLLHGIIAPVSFVISLFQDDVALYAMNNNGGWYDFGFVLGAGILFGGSGKAS